MCWTPSLTLGLVLYIFEQPYLMPIVDPSFCVYNPEWREISNRRTKLLGLLRREFGEAAKFVVMTATVAYRQITLDYSLDEIRHSGYWLSGAKGGKGLETHDFLLNEDLRLFPN
jgi:hypothetical protein